MAEMAGLSKNERFPAKSYPGYHSDLKQGTVTACESSGLRKFSLLISIKIKTCRSRPPPFVRLSDLSAEIIFRFISKNMFANQMIKTDSRA